MPHAIEEFDSRQSKYAHRSPKARSPKNREGQSLHSQVVNIQTLYTSSEFGRNLLRSLANALKTTTTPIKRILSLGLGSLSWTGKGQTRRLKQLAILLAIREQLRELNGGHAIQVYAQDPVYTRADETFLASLDINILRTSSGSSLGESASLLAPSTLIYSPFLTLEAYEALFGSEPQSIQPQLLVSDDFNALKEKWPKHSPERPQVERLMKGPVSRYRRRAVQGGGFWGESDESFPMAVYSFENRTREKARI